MVVLLALAIGLGIAAKIAMDNASEAMRQSRIALARQLAAQSQAALEKYPQRSLLLAVEALATTKRYGEPRVPIAEEVLRQALSHTGGRGLSGHEGSISSIAISPDSHWLVTSSYDKTARLWDLSAKNPGTTAIVLRGHDDVISSLAFSSDNRWLVTGGLMTARLWDLTAKDPSAKPSSCPATRVPSMPLPSAPTTVGW